IRTSMEQAEQIKETLAQTEGQVREHIDTARREGKNIVAQAGSVAEQIREEARREAREESQAIIDRARTEIERERDEAIDELKRQFVDLAIAAAERVIEETLDRDKHRQLIEDVLEEGGGKEG
ncbi:MAG: F0F1 ATP synthase subunit B, partial [Chloroflexota bacterium]|nr:F0F1 ATP synthase subunit B [Chloroflexota bacterium]